MRTIATAATILFTLCAPALADPPRSDRAEPTERCDRAEAHKVRFTLHDATTSRTFDLSVAAGPCATATEKTQDHEIDLRACVSGGTQLDVEWFMHSAGGEYRTKSSLAFARGATAELGTGNGPRLGVVVQ
jgi:hypothetical protein